MKFRKVFGSEAVQDIIREAHAVAATLPIKTVRDPWQDPDKLVDPTYGRESPGSTLDDLLKSISKLK